MKQWVFYSSLMKGRVTTYTKTITDIEENLIHTSDAVSSSSSSSSCDESQGLSRTPTPTPPKRAPKNDPPGRLDGKLKNRQLVHIPPTKNDKTLTRKC